LAVEVVLPYIAFHIQTIFDTRIDGEFSSLSDTGEPTVGDENGAGFDV
jgi:hypothetical protein